MPHDTDKQDLLKQIAFDNLNSIPASKSSDPRSFIEAAANWLGQWWKLRSSWTQISPGYCALVLDHEFEMRGLPEGFAEKSLFRDAPDAKLGGFIHVTDFSLTRVYKDRGGHDDADSIYQRLKLLNLGSAPCVIFSPESGILLFAEKGVLADVASTKLTDFDGTLTTCNVDLLLKEFYETAVKYPETFPHIWRNKENFVPVSDAEKLFQNLLFFFLKANTQKTWVIVREDQTNAGRTDLTLNGLNPTLIYVLEIKILKSFSYQASGKATRPFSEVKNHDWAISGVEQVVGYRIAKQAKEAYLLLYDMRSAHKKLKLVETHCGRENVRLNHYYVFNATARDVREARVKAAKTPVQTRAISAKPKRPRIR